MSLRPPSTSPSPSPVAGGNPKVNSRASMGPSNRPSPINLNPPTSPRPGNGRPASELLGGSGVYQTPEAEAIDQWFENLQNYEATLEEMAAASLDVNFKEELSAIEQWFRVLSEAERTAALYSLLQHSTQVQIRFFITVLQQMAKADPMTALLSPGAGGSMQTQMEAKLAQMGLKSAGIKSNMPSSPSARNFSGIGVGNRQSLAVEPTTSSFLSPDSAVVGNNSDAAATLAQQRAKLKANAQHRISAPALAGAAGNVWGGTGANSLGQVAERISDAENGQEITISPAPSSVLSSVRPKSTDFSGLLRSPRVSSGGGADADALESQLSPMVGGNWASMVNTPHDLMFNVQDNGGQNLDAAATKLASWQVGNSGGRFSLDDAKKFRRTSKSNGTDNANTSGFGGVGGASFGDDSGMQQQRNGRNPNLTVNQAHNNGLRSPALSNVSSGRFGPGSDSNVGSDNGLAAMNMNAFGMGMQSPNMANMEFFQRLQAQMRHASPMMLQQMQQLNMMGMSPGLNGMGGMNGMGMPGDANQQMQALLAAQMAAAGVNPFMQPGMPGFDMSGLSPQAQAAMFGQMQQGRNSRPPNMRMGSGGGAGGGSRSNNGRDSSTAGRDKDEEVDPKVLEDVPAWLRSLRLHKYTPNFESMRWQDMVLMDEAALEAKGVAALGARRKMLKTFEAVRNKMGVKMPGDGSSPAAGAGEGGAEAETSVDA